MTLKKSSPNIRVISNSSKLFTFAAKKIAQQITQSIKEKESAVIALAGGRSAATLCSQLVKQKIEWTKVHIFLIDERLVPITDNESNFKIINDSLIVPLSKKKSSLLRSNVHPFFHDALQVDGGAQRYADELSLVGGKYDVIFVSAGEDGHVAGLYPRHPLLKNKIGAFATFHDSPKPPAHRMTSLPGLFSSATFSLLLILGDVKRDALIKLKSKKLTARDCPAKLVMSASSHLVLTNLTKE
jgi:6-phosphogluconolactonase